MFRSCLGIVFGLKRLTFGCIFCSKSRYMTSKIKILGQNLALWEGHFDHFGAQKSRFLDILKVGLEMFRSCFGIIFGLKRRIFKCIFSLKGWYMTSTIKILDHIFFFWAKNYHFEGVCELKSPSESVRWNPLNLRGISTHKFPAQNPPSSVILKNCNDINRAKLKIQLFF